MHIWRECCMYIHWNVCSTHDTYLKPTGYVYTLKCLLHNVAPVIRIQSYIRFLCMARMCMYVHFDVDSTYDTYLKLRNCTNNLLQYLCNTIGGDASGDLRHSTHHICIHIRIFIYIQAHTYSWNIVGNSKVIVSKFHVSYMYTFIGTHVHIIWAETHLPIT